MEKQELIELAREAETNLGRLKQLQTEFYPIYFICITRLNNECMSLITSEKNRRDFLKHCKPEPEAEFNIRTRRLAERRRLAGFVEVVFHALDGPTEEDYEKWDRMLSRVGIREAPDCSSSKKKKCK